MMFSRIHGAAARSTLKYAVVRGPPLAREPLHLRLPPLPQQPVRPVPLHELQLQPAPSLEAAAPAAGLPFSRSSPLSPSGVTVYCSAAMSGLR